MVDSDTVTSKADTDIPTYYIDTDTSPRYYSLHLDGRERNATDYSFKSPTSRSHC